MEARKPARVLLADDDPTIRSILVRLLRQWGYEVVEAADGNVAWEILDSPTPPNIAILDWMMPGCDGPELCHRYHDGTRARPFLYILLLTSKSDKEDVVRGLDSGADDYVTKPVASEELRSRLNVARRMVEYEATLKDFGTNMERLARERAAQLVHADRLSTLGTLAASIIHEINNPVGYISANAQMLEKYWEKLKPLVDAGLTTGVPPDPRAPMIIEDMPRLAHSIHSGALRIADIVDNLKRFIRKEPETGHVVVTINEALDNALTVCRPRIKHGIKLTLDLADPPARIRVLGQQLEQVFINLIVNAQEAMDGQPERHLRIATGIEAGRLVVSFENSGPWIPPAQLASIWNSFFTTKEEGTGLGLAISQTIVKEHKGDITAENLPSGGVRFQVHLPVFHA